MDGDGSIISVHTTWQGDCLILPHLSILELFRSKGISMGYNQMCSWHLNASFYCRCLKSMDIFFQDPSAVPLPPEEVRIKSFKAEPWPDGRRVRIYLEITPFLKRPNSELVILDEKGREIASLTIIESITSRMELTMHLRAEETAGRYTASAALYYLDDNPESGEISGFDQQGLESATKRKVVDHQEIVFEIANEDPDSAQA